MNPAICALSLILSCGSKQAAALNVAYALSAFGDTYATQHTLLVVCPRYGVTCWESNPFMKPFQSHGRALAYTYTAGEVFTTNYITARLRESDNKTWRTIGRVLPFVQIAAHGYGIRANFTLTRSIKREAAQR